MLDSSKVEEQSPLLCKLEAVEDEDESSERVTKKRQSRCRDKELKGMNTGHWTELQKKLYFVFLMEHQSHFFNKEMRRLDKIFKAMANFIGTRAADQCRSHHQKIQKKYHTFSNILVSLQKHYGEENLEAPPVKVEAEHPIPAGRQMFEEPSDKANQAELCTPFKLEALKQDNMNRLCTSSTLGMDHHSIDNEWNMGEGLDQLHYL